MARPLKIISENRAALCVSGLLLGFISVLPHAGAFLSLFIYIPFIRLIKSSAGSRAQNYLRLYLFSLFFYAGGLYWIYRFTVAGIIMASAYLALFPLGTRWIYGISGKRSMAIPFAWTLMESLKEIGPLAYTWNAPGYMLSYLKAAAGNASWGGVTALTFFVIFVNMLISETIMFKKKKDAMTCAAAMILFFAAGSIALKARRATPDDIKISAVQPSVSLFEKWDEAFIRKNMDLYEKLSGEVPEDTDLVIWPETAFSAGITWYPPEKETLRRIIGNSGKNTSHLVGSTHYEGSKKYNSLYLIGSDGAYVRYDKIRLLPVAEYVPWEWLYKALKKIYPIEYNLTRGTRAEPLRTEKFSVCAVICFESMFGGHIDHMMRQGADFMVISTNDGWFYKTPAPRNHLQMAVVRAIEQDSWVVHCANSGISAVIDNRGAIKEMTTMDERTVLNGRVGSRQGRGIYSYIRIYVDYAVPLAALMIFLFLSRRSVGGKQ